MDRRGASPTPFFVRDESLFLSLVVVLLQVLWGSFTPLRKKGKKKKNSSHVLFSPSWDFFLPQVVGVLYVSG